MADKKKFDIVQFLEDDRKSSLHVRNKAKPDTATYDFEAGKVHAYDRMLTLIKHETGVIKEKADTLKERWWRIMLQGAAIGAAIMYLLQSYAYKNIWLPTVIENCN